MASKEKLEVASSFVVMPLNNASGIVLDTTAPKAIVNKLRKTGIVVHLAR